MGKFKYLPLASPLLSHEERRAVLREYETILEHAGGIDFAADAHEPGEPIVCFVMTGGTEAMILEHVRSCSVGAPDAPVLLIAYPGRNSLPAALETLARLQQDGQVGRIVFLEGPDDRAGAERLQAALMPNTSGIADRAPAAYPKKTASRLLRGKRIGLVGEPSDWLVTSSPLSSIVSEVWGPEIVEIQMEELERRIDICPPESLNSFVDPFTTQAGQVIEPSGSDFLASGSIYTALRTLIDDLKLDAVSIRCFDLVVDRKATGCLALSRLADEGFVAGCEGDLPSALAMLWVQERLRAMSWMANPARVNVESNTLTLAHCTVPCSMVNGFKLRSHFESNLGAALEGSMALGPVTLLRIGGKALDDLWVAEGEIVSTGCEDTLCRTQVDVQLRDFQLSELLDHPLGNHLVLTPGHVAGELLAGT